MISMDYRFDYYIAFNWSIARSYCQKYLDSYAAATNADPPYDTNDDVLVVGDYIKHFWTPDTFSPDIK